MSTAEKIVQEIRKLFATIPDHCRDEEVKQIITWLAEDEGGTCEFPDFKKEPENDKEGRDEP